jgi:hypothetical protein
LIDKLFCFFRYATLRPAQGWSDGAAGPAVGLQFGHAQQVVAAFVSNANSKKQALAAASASSTTISNHRIRVNLEASFVTLVTFC